MPRPRYEHLAILERRRDVAARFVRGEAQYRIAQALEVDNATITRDIVAIEAEWVRQCVLDMDERKARELAKVDEIERQAWAAWVKSQENAETLRARMQGEKATTEKVSKGQAGDPRFLDVVLKCVERRCKILGADAQPDKPPDAGKPPPVLSETERAAVLASFFVRVGLLAAPSANGGGQLPFGGADPP